MKGGGPRSGDETPGSRFEGEPALALRGYASTCAHRAEERRAARRTRSEPDVREMDVLRPCSVVLLGVLACSLSWLGRPCPASCLRPELARPTDLGAAAQSCPLVRDYLHTRGLFLDAARAAGAELHELRPVAGDESLVTDVAVLRGGARGGLLLHIAGTHGVEGFVGSGIQRAALRTSERWLARGGERMPTVVFVHGLNPFGMAHWRRADDANVDLNRNCLIDEEGWAKARNASREGEVLYSRLAWPATGIGEAEGARMPPAALAGQVAFIWRALRAMFAARAGPLELKRSLVGGTYFVGKGLFYGGRELRPSHALLHALLRREGLLAGKRRAVVVDVHSGLGPKGKDTLMMGVEHAQASEVGRGLVAAAAAVAELGAGAYAVERLHAPSEEAGAASAGYELMMGGTDGCLAQLLRAEGSGSELLLSLAQEFGSVRSLHVLTALAAENQAYWHAPPTAAFAAAKEAAMGEEGRRALAPERWPFAAALVDALTPADGHFAAEVTARGVGLLERAVELLARGEQA